MTSKLVISKNNSFSLWYSQSENLTKAIISYNWWTLWIYLYLFSPCASDYHLQKTSQKCPWVMQSFLLHHRRHQFLLPLWLFHLHGHKALSSGHLTTPHTPVRFAWTTKEKEKLYFFEERGQKTFLEINGFSQRAKQLPRSNDDWNVTFTLYIRIHNLFQMIH